MDGDTGFGNYNNARRLVRKLEERGVAGVCFEDKVFPKRNSLGEGAQQLADINEFCNKIKVFNGFLYKRLAKIIKEIMTFKLWLDANPLLQDGD